MSGTNNKVVAITGASSGVGEAADIPGAGTGLAVLVGHRVFAWSPRSTVQVDIALAISLPSGSVTSHST
jgi:NAD(P)-dependent dehydrogenase (short-subunit alcohol dehydrogenase family)